MSVAGALLLLKHGLAAHHAAPIAQTCIPAAQWLAGVAQSQPLASDQHSTQPSGQQQDHGGVHTRVEAQTDGSLPQSTTPATQPQRAHQGRRSRLWHSVAHAVSGSGGQDHRNAAPWHPAACIHNQAIGWLPAALHPSTGRRRQSCTASAALHQLHVRWHATQSSAAGASIALPGLLSCLPPAAVPYAQLMRLDKPIGTWLLLWPSLWSIALAAPQGHLPDPYIMTLFSAGALLLRGAGCTINDLWDRDLDSKVERTRTRPLASGALQPRHAIGLLAAQLSLGLMILLQLNTYSQLLGASSLLLVGTYPLMKRITYWPQAFLGLTINWGALLGWAAVRGSCDWSVVLPLYLSGVCWSIVYDTIYAHQDTKDDLKAGVRSTALLFGDNTKPILAAFAATQLAALCAAGAAAGAGDGFYAGAAGLAAHLTWQLARVDLKNGPMCAETFVSNKWAGAIVFLGCVAGRFWP